MEITGTQMKEVKNEEKKKVKSNDLGKIYDRIKLTVDDYLDGMLQLGFGDAQVNKVFKQAFACGIESALCLVAAEMNELDKEEIQETANKLKTEIIQKFTVQKNDSSSAPGAVRGQKQSWK